MFGTTEDAVNLTLVGYYLFLAVGLLVFGPLSDKLGRKPVLVGGLAAYCASSAACALSSGIGALAVAVGHASAFAFCGMFIVFAFFEAAVRPYAVATLLDQQEGDAGSASALINFTRTFTGSIGMLAVMAPVFGDYIGAVGWLMAGGMALALVGWAALLRSPVPLAGVK